jgi:uncharacterized membrane protein
MRTATRALGGFWIFAGTMHFLRPREYEATMPPYIPAHKEMVAISGVAELAGGVGVLLPRTRDLSGRCLIALLVAVFPANVHMALNPDQVKLKGIAKIPRWALFARLALQPVFAVWAWRATRPQPDA